MVLPQPQLPRIPKPLFISTTQRMTQLQPKERVKDPKTNLALQPLQIDLLQHCHPVCAEWDAYRNRASMTPHQAFTHTQLLPPGARSAVLPTQYTGLKHSIPHTKNGSPSMPSARKA